MTMHQHIRQSLQQLEFTSYSFNCIFIQFIRPILYTATLFLIPNLKNELGGQKRKSNEVVISAVIGYFEEQDV